MECNENALRHAGYTAVQLKSSEDEPGSPKVTEAKRETPLKYLKRIKGYSSKKVAQLTADSAHSVGSRQELEATVPLEN